MQTKQWQQASKPQLLLITNLSNSIPKTRYIVYYQIPIYPGLYKSIDELQEVLVNDGSIRFRILDLQANGEPPLLKPANFVKDKEGGYGLGLKFADGELTIKAKPINQAEGANIVFSVRVLQIQGYANFLKFRHKYRTLQNITRKQNFSLGHRIKIVNPQTSIAYIFPLEENDPTVEFFPSGKVKLQLEQIYSMDEWQMSEIIVEEELDFRKLENSVKCTINVLGKFTFVVGVECIRNDDLLGGQLAALRVLECASSAGVGSAGVGTEKSGQVCRIYPLVEDKYYDYEFGYLNENLKGESLEEVYGHMKKLSKSFPVYPHLKNSQLVQIEGCKYIWFDLQERKTKKGSKIKVPLVYIMKGLNIIENEDVKIKFYIQLDGNGSGSLKKSTPTHDIRRVYDARIQDIWNLGQIAKKYPNFQLKIILADIIYWIPFTSSTMDSSSFPKQWEQLSEKSQHSQLLQNKYYMVTDAGNNKLTLTKTESINKFYILDLFNSSSATLQVVSGVGEILMQGTVERARIVEAAAKGVLRVVLGSPVSFLKSVLVLSLQQIKQANASLRTYYGIFYRLQFLDRVPCSNVNYNLQISRQNTQKSKSYRKKISPEMSDDGLSTLYKMEGGFFQATVDDMELGVSLRKMYYDEVTEQYDGGEIVSKRVVVNASAKQILQKNTIFLQIKEEGYNSTSFDFYDPTIKKRLTLYLQVTMKKKSLLDQESSRYYIKIPNLLWAQSHLPSEQVQLETHISKRRFRGEKNSIGSGQETSLVQANYRDGLGVRVGGLFGYDRIIDAIKVRCDVNGNQIGWLDDSEWYLGLINIGQLVLHFMIRWAFDPNAKNLDSQSSDSQKTASNAKSERSYSNRIDPLAKTVRNMDLVNLKKNRNTLVEEGRHLTAKHVQREETIIGYNKKISEVEDRMQKYEMYRKTVVNNTGSMEGDGAAKGSAGYRKKVQLYRSICQCGDKNPKFNGFCESCLRSLRKRYQTFQKQYKQLSYTYEQKEFQKYNSKQKYHKMKNKLKLYKQHLRSGESISENPFSDIITSLSNTDLKTQIEQLKVEIFRLDEERARVQGHTRKMLEKVQDRIRVEDGQILQGVRELGSLKMQLQTIGKEGSF